MDPIVFFSNWERTETWIEAGRELARRGAPVFFVVTRKEYVERVLAAGFGRDRILWLTRQGCQRSEVGPAQSERLRQYEAATGERVRDFILMDRFMRSADPVFAERYALYVFAEIAAFFERNGIRLAVGQPDNIPDLIAHMILKADGGRYAAPFEFRLPSRRFMLWDSKIEARPHPTGPATPAEVPATFLAEAKRLRDRVRAGHKMRQVAAKSVAPRLGFGFVHKLLRGFLYRALVTARHDVYMYTLRSVLFDLKYHLIPVNYRLLRLVWKRLFEQPVEGERFVFYALNYAPEHTVDVEAPYFTGTLETVRNIARSLPLGVRLYVKEHPTGLGIRGPIALRQLKRLPGVRLIDPFVDSHALIRNAALTVSLSGTVSLEAALYGRPSLVISDIFVKNFSWCRRIEAPWQVGPNLDDGWAPPAGWEERDLAYLAWLIANSHEGTVIEPLVDPTSLEPANVGLVATALMKLIEGTATGNPPTE